jgi:hypothetical protein
MVLNSIFFVALVNSRGVPIACGHTEQGAQLHLKAVSFTFLENAELRN